MIGVSTSTDQAVVTMTVEEFNQVLHLVASGIQLASANTEGAAVQVGLLWLAKLNFQLPTLIIDTDSGAEDQAIERVEATDLLNVKTCCLVLSSSFPPVLCGDENLQWNSWSGSVFTCIEMLG